MTRRYTRKIVRRTGWTPTPEPVLDELAIVLGLVMAVALWLLPGLS